MADKVFPLDRVARTVDITSMDDEIEPNAITYSTLIRALNFLMPRGEERNTVGKAVFEKSKKAGLVDNETLKNLKMVLDARSLQDALEGNLDRNGDYSLSLLPSAWKKNAV